MKDALEAVVRVYNRGVQERDGRAEERYEAVSKEEEEIVEGDEGAIALQGVERLVSHALRQRGFARLGFRTHLGHDLDGETAVVRAGRTPRRALVGLFRSAQQARIVSRGRRERVQPKQLRARWGQRESYH